MTKTLMNNDVEHYCTYCNQNGKIKTVCNNRDIHYFNHHCTKKFNNLLIRIKFNNGEQHIFDKEILVKKILTDGTLEFFKTELMNLQSKSIKIMKQYTNGDKVFYEGEKEREIKKIFISGNYEEYKYSDDGKLINTTIFINDNSDDIQEPKFKKSKHK
jgi:hypothetical protein